MSSIASARYTCPHDSPVVISATNLDKAAVGRRDSTSPERSAHRHHLSTVDMNDDLNPQAMPFRPGGATDDTSRWDSNRSQDAAPALPPFGHPGAPWEMGFAPPHPAQFFTGQYPYYGYDAQAQVQAHHHYWPQNYGHEHRQVDAQGHYAPRYDQSPAYPQQYYPPHYLQQQQYPLQQPSSMHPAQYQAMQRSSWLQGAPNEEPQLGTRPVKKSKKAKAKAKAAANEKLAQEAPLPVRPKPTPTPTSTKKGKYGDEKIMLPAPQPTDPYLSQAAEEPSESDSPGSVLVILDLNGTVLYRPNKNAKSMIARPYLKPFLRYLFENFKVMVWSSAKPVNVKSLVEQSLDKHLRSKLVDTWARDTFGLSATNYNQNVQVYKNLKLIWSRDQIQQHHPEYNAGKRFGQHNTVLIDDTALKASAQPHNLLEIPEFMAKPEQMKQDVLREVAGYLEVLRNQTDVSKFINKHGFQCNGRWTYNWPVESADGGVMKEKVSSNGEPPAPKTQVLEVMDSMSSVSLGGTAQKEA